MSQLYDFILSKHFRVSRHLIRNMDLLRKQRKGISEDEQQDREPDDKTIEPTPTDPKETVEEENTNDSQAMIEASRDELTQDDHED